MSNYKKLSQLLKKRREELDITQLELSQKLNSVHTQFISNWERGLCNPPNHALPRLISILGINKTQLVEVLVEDYRDELESRFNLRNAKKLSHKVSSRTK